MRQYKVPNTLGLPSNHFTHPLIQNLISKRLCEQLCILHFRMDTYQDFCCFFGLANIK